MEETWIEPNYNMADIIEYEMNLERRRNVEDFVLQFFKDWESNDESRLLVMICKDLVKDTRIRSIIDDTFLYVTQQNFSTSYRHMCLDLFKNGVEDHYMVSLFVFSIVLDQTMKSHIWYSSGLLYKCLIDVLEEVCFEPKNFGWYKTCIDLMKTITSTMVIILPPLLFFHDIVRS